MKNWALQDAKAKFSEVITRADQQGPQQITVRGKPAAVVLSQTDYQKLTEQKPNFLKFIKQSPLAGIELDIQRDTSPTRHITL